MVSGGDCCLFTAPIVANSLHVRLEPLHATEKHLCVNVVINEESRSSTQDHSCWFFWVFCT